MTKAWLKACAAVLLTQALVLAQTAATNSVLGAVVSFNKDTKVMEVKPDNATSLTVKLPANAVIQQVAPGETSLAKATTVTASEIAVGDRVLVSLASNRTDALRVIIMSAGDIAKRDEADRQDWAQRGISGIVAGKNGSQILLKQRTPRGDVQQTIAVSERTKFRRYSPDSVKFGDAQVSKLEEVAVGDQIRARGNKSADGLKVDAEEVVFGTFVTRAGTVASVDTASKQVTVKEIGNGKSFTIKLTSDSALKQMPAATDARGTPPAGANINQLIDRLPAAQIEDVKPGASVVVSGTKGSDAEKVTAIMLVTNADILIRMASTPSGRGGTLVFGSNDGGGLSVLGIQ